MRTIIAIVVLLALSAAGFAAKVTVDPNVPGASPAVEKPDDVDARLAEKITYIAKGKTISAILDDLTKSTGITFRAGYNSGDWQVRDRKMTISVTDVPISRLISSMARVMKFKWQRSGEPGEYSYRLYLDRKTLLDIEAQRAREEERAQAALAKKRAEGMEQYSKLADLTEEEQLDLKQSNPFLYMAARSGLGNSLGSFFKEVPSAFDAIATGNPLEIRGSQLSAVAQNSLMSAVRDMSRMEQRLTGRTRSVPEDIDPSKASIKFNDNMDHFGGFPMSSFLLGNMSISYGDSKVDIPFIDPQSGLAKTVGTVFNESQEQNRSIESVIKDHISEFVDAMKSEAKAAVEGEALNEQPDDPALNEKIEIKGDINDLPDAQLALAESAKIGVVSDYFGSGMRMRMALSGDTTIKTVLDAITDSYFYNWTKHQGVLEFRDRNWFKKRAAQLPEAQLDVWRKELNSTGTLDLASLSQIAQLEPDQFMQNVTGDEILGKSRSLSNVILSNRELLKFYGTLSAEQRSALLSRSGLDFAMLSKEQYSQASKLIKSRVGANAVESASSIVVSFAREASKGDTGIKYEIALTVEGNAIDSVWTFTTPVAPLPKATENQPNSKPAK